MAAQVNYPVAPVTQDTHEFTYNCQFDGEESVGLVTKEGFRNLLDAHIGSLNKAKQVSYTRNREWLNAIREGNTMPPAGYAGNQATWKNEIGATNPATSKWVVEGDRVYKKTKNAKEGGPMTPTECLYDLMTKVHLAHGHKGRDNFFSLVKPYSGSIKKAFCHQFVQVCCEKAESWQAGGSVPHGWQSQAKHRKARNNTANNDDNDEAGNIEHPATPQAMSQDVEQFRFMDINVGELNAQMAQNGDFDFQPQVRPNLLTPPGSLGSDLESGVPSYFTPNQYLPAAQNPVGDQYAPGDAQHLLGFQNPVSIQYGADVDNRIFQQVQDAMQMQGAQQMRFNNYGQLDFVSQGPQAARYYPEVEQHDQVMSNNDMIAEQHDYNRVNNDMVIDQYNQIMYNNSTVVDVFGIPQIPPMLGNPYAMQLAQNNLDAPTSHINFAEMGADNLLGIDMSMHNSQYKMTETIS